MYENSCIICPFPSPASPTGARGNGCKREIESDEQNKANPTPVSCPLAPGSLGGGVRSIETRRLGGRAGGSTMRAGMGPLWHGLLLLGSAMEARWRKLVEALSMYIYTWLRPCPPGEGQDLGRLQLLPPPEGWGSGDSSAKICLQGGQCHLRGQAPFSRFPSPDLGLGEPQRALALYGRKPGAEVKSPGSSPGPGDCH